MLGMRDWHHILHLWEHGQRPFALSTLVRADGSSFRPLGARVLMDAAGRMAGTITAGCMEHWLPDLAARTLTTGLPTLTSVDTGRLFGCGRTIEVFTERLDGDDPLGTIQRNWRERRASILETIWDPDRAACERRTRVLTRPYDGEGLIVTVQPSIRLWVFGSHADGEPVLEMARTLGWDCRVFADLPNPELAASGDARTAVLVKFHHFGRDLAALAELVASPVGYVGLMGSTVRGRRLLSGLSEARPALAHLIARVCMPAGLELGGESAAEYALELVAQIQGTLAKARVDAPSKLCSSLPSAAVDLMASEPVSIHPSSPTQSLPRVIACDRPGNVGFCKAGQDIFWSGIGMGMDRINRDVLSRSDQPRSAVSPCGPLHRSRWHPPFQRGFRSGMGGIRSPDRGWRIMAAVAGMFFGEGRGARASGDRLRVPDAQQLRNGGFQGSERSAVPCLQGNSQQESIEYLGESLCVGCRLQFARGERPFDARLQGLTVALVFRRNCLVVVGRPSAVFFSSAWKSGPTPPKAFGNADEY